MIKEDATISIRKHANALKAHKKTVKTAIKQDLSSDLHPLDCAIWGVLENKTNATSNPNKTAMEEEWDKMSEEFILKTYKSFRRRVDTIIEKMAAVLSKITILCVSSYFIVYFIRVVNHYTRIFLILLLYLEYIYIIWIHCVGGNY